MNDSTSLLRTKNKREVSIIFDYPVAQWDMLKWMQKFLVKSDISLSGGGTIKIPFLLSPMKHTLVTRHRATWLGTWNKFWCTAARAKMPGLRTWSQRWAGPETHSWAPERQFIPRVSQRACEPCDSTLTETHPRELRRTLRETLLTRSARDSHAEKRGKTQESRPHS